MTTTNNVINTYTAFFADANDRDYVFYWNNGVIVTVHLRGCESSYDGEITTEREVDCFTFSTRPTVDEVVAAIDRYLDNMNGEI